MLSARSLRVLAVIGLLGPPSMAITVFNSTNGHAYDLVHGTYTWEEARIAAEAMSALGVQGHLVSITTTQENLFLNSEYGDILLQRHWIGGFQEPGSAEPAAGWKWITGEALTAINWAGGEPNNNFGSSPNEDRLAFDHAADAEGKQWNDLPGSFQLDGFVVEFDLTTWTDLGLGLAGTTGPPHASGSGTLAGGTTVTLDLEAAKPFSTSFLVVGVSAITATFKGGTLVPTPHFLFPLFSDFSGKVTFGGPWPTGAPPGFTIYFQWWIQDPAGPKGFAASNALAGTTP